MDINFIRAPRNVNLVKHRQKVDSEICRQYQQQLITQILNISIRDRDENLTVPEQIKSCLKEVKMKVLVFERSTHGRGYRINCDLSERKRFVDLIMTIVRNSDYVRKLFEIWNNLYNDNGRHMELEKVVGKYGKLINWIRLLENTEESNKYGNNWKFRKLDLIPSNMK